MDVRDFPEDLLAYLRSGSPPTLEAGDYKTVTLFAPEELRVETLEVTPTMAPFVFDHPHGDECGYYAVQAVNLVRGETRPDQSQRFPAWLFLWLPHERRFGSYDLDHGDLLMFPPDASWSRIVADPLPFVRASDGLNDGPVAVDYLEPWHRHPWINTDNPYTECLFSYGDLQKDDVQLSTFGRRLQGERDELVGFELSSVEIKTKTQIKNPDIATASGKTHHANVIPNGQDDSRVSGIVFEISENELGCADEFEKVAEYKRIAVTLASGKNAWVYVYAYVGVDVDANSAQDKAAP